MKWIIKLLKKLGRDTRAISAQSIIMMAIALLIVAYVAPIALDAIASPGNTTAWNTAVWTVFTVVLPIVFVVGVAIKFIKGGKVSGG